VDRLVDPLLAGLRGTLRELSFDATLPALAAASRNYRSLAEAARSLLPSLGRTPSRLRTKTYGTEQADRVHDARRGLGALPDFLAKASTAAVRTTSVARELSRTENGWRITVGSRRLRIP